MEGTSTTAGHGGVERRKPTAVERAYNDGMAGLVMCTLPGCGRHRLTAIRKDAGLEEDRAMKAGAYALPGEITVVFLFSIHCWSCQMSYAHEVRLGRKDWNECGEERTGWEGDGWRLRALGVVEDTLGKGTKVIKERADYYRECSCEICTEENTRGIDGRKPDRIDVVEALIDREGCVEQRIVGGKWRTDGMTLEEVYKGTTAKGESFWPVE